MPVLLFGIGVFAVVAGLVMIGFGIPINEFSFGNTLIIAGTTASVGGLIIIAVGVAVGQLRRIAGMLADRAARLPGSRMPADDLEPGPAVRNGLPAPAAVQRLSRPAAHPFRQGRRPIPLRSSRSQVLQWPRHRRANGRAAGPILRAVAAQPG